ncbi:hypothetical protein TrLO_g8891 [Triparma laevis f. longispina]|uniref:Uncharacterized protein n=1 Tax=Triparma laevis f. longispina TaxID=1714387 RepID=A0A9W7CAM6_9STRA|nr:hypothetical protein TrLO_g8891 [Triparma laevis f. longispina]
MSQFQTQDEFTQQEFTQPLHSQIEEVTQFPETTSLSSLKGEVKGPWGKLIPSRVGGQQYDLEFKAPTQLLPPKNANTPPIQIFGLSLTPGTHFSHYTLGRSPSANLTLAPLDKDSHRLISNRHCSLYCQLTEEIGLGQLRLEVYLEDTSANGTTINGSIRLRKGERRLLNTGDEIGLVGVQNLNKGLGKKEKMDIVRGYSWTFLNVWQQRAPVTFHLPSSQDNAVGVGHPPLMPPPSKPPSNPPTPVSRSSTIQSGRIEEWYDLRHTLGTGTCGLVKFALNKQTGQRVAVKIIPKSKWGKEEWLGEVEVQKNLNHPYIVGMVDVFEDAKAVYLVMELMEGGDLFDRIIKLGFYEEGKARKVMRRLLSSVSYLHSLKIIHRDLKPENIMLPSSSDVAVKLTDFGLAKEQGEGLKTFCGTPQYFAPEVMRRRMTVKGRGRYDVKSDMWSLGVIMYVLLSGAPPFDVQAGWENLASTKIQFTGPRWGSVSAQGKELVLKLLDVDPVKRFSVEEAMDHPWIGVEDGDTHVHPLDDPLLKDVKYGGKRKKRDSGAGVVSLDEEKPPPKKVKPPPAPTPTNANTTTVKFAETDHTSTSGGKKKKRAKKVDNSNLAGKSPGSSKILQDTPDNELGEDPIEDEEDFAIGSKSLQSCGFTISKAERVTPKRPRDVEKENENETMDNKKVQKTLTGEKFKEVVVPPTEVVEEKPPTTNTTTPAIPEQPQNAQKDKPERGQRTLVGMWSSK